MISKLLRHKLLLFLMAWFSISMLSVSTAKASPLTDYQNLPKTLTGQSNVFVNINDGGSNSGGAGAYVPDAFIKVYTNQKNGTNRVITVTPNSITSDYFSD